MKRVEFPGNRARHITVSKNISFKTQQSHLHLFNYNRETTQFHPVFNASKTITGILLPHLLSPFQPRSCDTSSPISPKRADESRTRPINFHSRFNLTSIAVAQTTASNAQARNEEIFDFWRPLGTFDCETASYLRTLKGTAPPLGVCWLRYFQFRDLVHLFEDIATRSAGQASSTVVGSAPKFSRPGILSLQTGSIFSDSTRASLHRVTGLFELRATGHCSIAASALGRSRPSGRRGLDRGSASRLGEVLCGRLGGTSWILKSWAIEDGIVVMQRRVRSF